MMETQQPAAKRLCSEIQLFDLCDLDTCICKDGRYCTNPAILQRFEAIKEEDERSHYVAEEYDEEEEDAEEFDGQEDDYEEDE